MYKRSELDYLIYNDPLAYADLILKQFYKTYKDDEFVTPLVTQIS